MQLLFNKDNGMARFWQDLEFLDVSRFVQICTVKNIVIKKLFTSRGR